MSPEPDQQEAESLKRRSYVCVVDTNDEWEDAIGVVEDILLGDASVPASSEGCEIIVFFPLLREDIQQLKLVGVNFFTAPCRHELRKNAGMKLFPVKNLEFLDPAEL